ncbi:MAG: hypothetical protein IPP44_15060 [Ideonella sp.]|nr:hypothetical protein [Ideonella sp.]
MPGAPPLLTAERIEDAALPTVLFSGHGDVVRGHEGQWWMAQDPWTLAGPASAGMAAEAQTTRASITSTSPRWPACCTPAVAAWASTPEVVAGDGEETGSLGLAEFCVAQRSRLAADALIASDGPRLRADRPTVPCGRAAWLMSISC